MKKLFTSDKFFGAITILAIVCTILNTVMVFVATRDTMIYSAANLVSTICVATLFVSYKNHSKNVMKGMLGALLMQIFMTNLFSINIYFGDFDKIMMYILLAIVTALIINHFIINSEQKASPTAIRFNQVLCVLYALVMLADIAYFVAIDETILEKFGDMLGGIAAVCTSTVIVCVESRLDVYRLEREAAGWTEEKGYPEGYVHEYEKK